ncbi:MAG: carbohydrate ABC transporter permease [Clostridia bacterium]|nr:carbohydrate ABC transporter permease [Clostridia bacterium]
MAKKIKEKKNTFTPLTIVLLVFLCIYCLSLFYLLAWGTFTSFKVNDDVFKENPAGFFVDYLAYYTKWRRGWTENGSLDDLDKANYLRQQLAEMGNKDWLLPFHTYKNMFTQFVVETDPMPGMDPRKVGMPEMYLYSLLYAGGCAFTATFVPCITAYACARFNYKFSRIVHTTVIIVMMIPIVGSMPSEIKMAQATGVMNKIWGLWIMRANFLGLYFLVFYDVCKALPASFSEAAKIDGANNFQIFFQIAMPLIKNTFMTILLIKFISFWNDYQAAMVFMPSYPTVAIGLNKIMNINADSTRYNHQMVPARMAAVVMTATPVCILFAIFQKRLLGNLTVGGVKG